MKRTLAILAGIILSFGLTFLPLTVAMDGAALPMHLAYGRTSTNVNVPILVASDGSVKISGGGGGSGTVTSVATTSPITGGPFTTTGTIACPTCQTASYTNVSFSATPIFDASVASYQRETLTANVTSSTISNPTAGELFTLELIQDATGSRTFVFPTNIVGACTISPTASQATRQTFRYDGTNWNAAASCTYSDTPFFVIAATRGTPGSNPASGSLYLFASSAGSDNILKGLDASGNVSVMPRGLTSATTNQWVQYIDQHGIQNLAQPAASNLSNGVTGSGAVVLANAPTFVTGQVTFPDGLANAPSFRFTSANIGFYAPTSSSVGVVIASALAVSFDATNIWHRSDSASIVMGSSADARWFRDGNGLISQRNGSVAQTYRIYGNETGAKYLKLTHDGTNPIIGSSSGAIKFDSTAVTPASTGTRYLCIGTDGTVASSAAVCAGT